MLLHEVLASLVASLRRANCDTARLDAELLLAQALGVSRSFIYAHRDDVITQQQLATAQQLIARRAEGEPVAHIIGEREFWSLPLQVDRRVLTPRPETECLVEAVLGLQLGASCSFIDAGTGSGAIALALLSEQPAWQGIALDIDSEALAVCKANALALGFANRLQIVRGHW
ncbi:MAG: peptide chain release factor N(5)-glutamine methyltransferase, partial [Pseudomonadales bacterium]|nr:peptide chain release factor N(5)-glutamine methyltransferase [Pseudomonadales bacterium]